MAAASDPAPENAPDSFLAERRAWVRYPAAIDGACQPLVQGSINQLWPARISDLSARGVGLTLDTPIGVNSLISVELPRVGGTDARRLLARVVRVADAGQGRWCLGCTFSIRLSDRELQEFLP